MDGERKTRVKARLEEAYQDLSPDRFIEADPVSVPHSFSKKEDIEIAAFLTATLSWGQRKTIMQKARSLMRRMDDAPYSFITEASPSAFKKFRDFQHRTFNGVDLEYFLSALRNIYRKHGGMHELFHQGIRTQDPDTLNGIRRFRSIFFSLRHPGRTEKHVADPTKGSPAKRLHMFLRWMVRDGPIDLGVWNDLGPHRLSCPLDVHSANVARRLGMLERKQNDRKSVEELDRVLREMDPLDPVKYDIALHRLGIEEAERS